MWDGDVVEMGGWVGVGESEMENHQDSRALHTPPHVGEGVLRFEGLGLGLGEVDSNLGVGWVTRSYTVIAFTVYT